MDGHANSGKKTSAAKLAASIAVVLVIGVGSFVGGIQYQKGHADSGTANLNGRFGDGNGQPGGMGGQGQNGTFGTVSAISASSISVQDQRTGTAKTYSISDATTITDNGTTATYSDIAVGDNVLVAADSSSSTAASRILLNPSMGGPGGGPGNQPSDSESTMNTTTN